VRLGPAHARLRDPLGLQARARRPLRDEGGQTLIETLVALVVFAIVATGIVNMLVSSTSITSLAKQRTLAEQGVNNQIEKIRAMDYNSIGTTSGNPSGTIPPSVAFTGLNLENLGVSATMTTDVDFASADVPGSALTGADDKKVVVTIKRNRDSLVLASAVTYVAPKLQASQTTGTVQATVTDIGNNSSPSGTVLGNVRVTLTPPAGLSPPVPSGPESDVTDASGTVSFAGLTPTSGSQTYSVGIASADMPNLYYARAVPAFQLSPTQILPESIQVYQPVTLKIALTNPNGTPWVGSANIVVTAGSGGTTYQFNNVGFTAAGTPYSITTQGPTGAPLLPNIDYFVAINATGYAAVSDDSIVPANGVYPATSAAGLAYTFTETMRPVFSGNSAGTDVWPINTSTKLYCSLVASLACNTFTANGNTTPAAGTTVSNVVITLGAAPAGSTATLTVALMRAGLSVGTCTITGPSGTTCTIPGPVTFNGSQTMNLQFSRSSGNDANVTASWTADHT
jgi:Tfp pilus assembly protein PilV